MQTDKSELMIDLAPYIRAIWQRKWLVVSMVLVSLIATLAWGRREKTVYQATAHIRIGRVWNEPVSDANVLIELADGDPFLARVRKRLSSKHSVAKLARQIKAERLEAGKGRSRYIYLVSLTSQADSPELAQELVQAAADQVLADSNQSFDTASALYLEREKELTQKVKDLKESVTKINSPTELYERNLEIQLAEQALAECQLNNRSPLKTFRTQLADQIERAEALPHPNLSKRLLFVGATSLAVALLTALSLAFVIPLLKTAVKGD